MITSDGWSRYSIWSHSAHIRDLYLRRCRLEEPEMTCAAQAARLLRPLVEPGEILLDAGCGAGYFFHSLLAHGISAEYYGIDAEQSLIDIGRATLPRYGLPADRLQVIRIEDLDAQVDHVLCMNVLSNLDNVHRPLERLLRSAGKTVVLRESIAEHAEYRYVRDEYLDEGVDLRVHVNTYAEADIAGLCDDLGFDATFVTDERAGDEPELVIGYPHHWRFVVAVRR